MSKFRLSISVTKDNKLQQAIEDVNVSPDYEPRVTLIEIEKTNYTYDTAIVEFDCELSAYHLGRREMLLELTSPKI